ncbi:hypothetical protein [Xanthomonas phage DES1]|nr:hypothetical protein [Xanthomonas phage DES1]
MSKVIKLDGCLIFDDGHVLSSDHDQDCCESHWLDFIGLVNDDFKGLDFDLSEESFFERVEDFGIRLLPVNGHPIPIPGYGANNGYYSSNLTLVLQLPNGKNKKFDITECQVLDDGY